MGKDEEFLAIRDLKLADDAGEVTTPTGGSMITFAGPAIRSRTGRHPRPSQVPYLRWWPTGPAPGPG